MNFTLDDECVFVWKQTNQSKWDFVQTARQALRSKKASKWSFQRITTLFDFLVNKHNVFFIHFILLDCFRCFNKFVLKSRCICLLYYYSCIKQVLKYWRMHQCRCYFEIKTRSFVADWSSKLKNQSKKTHAHTMNCIVSFRCGERAFHSSSILIRLLPFGFLVCSSSHFWKVQRTLQISSLFSIVCLFYHSGCLCLVLFALAFWVELVIVIDNKRTAKQTSIE